MDLEPVGAADLAAVGADDDDEMGFAPPPLDDDDGMDAGLLGPRASGSLGAVDDLAALEAMDEDGAAAAEPDDRSGDPMDVDAAPPAAAPRPKRRRPRRAVDLADAAAALDTDTIKGWMRDRSAIVDVKRPRYDAVAAAPADPLAPRLAPAAAPAVAAVVARLHGGDGASARAALPVNRRGAEVAPAPAPARFSARFDDDVEVARGGGEGEGEGASLGAAPFAGCDDDEFFRDTYIAAPTNGGGRVFNASDYDGIVVVPLGYCTPGAWSGSIALNVDETKEEFKGVYMGRDLGEPGWRSAEDGDGASLASTYMHELFHMMGAQYHATGLVCHEPERDFQDLLHRCADTNYGDFYDVMGSGNGFAPNLQAAIRYDMGWMGKDDVEFVETSGEYAIYPLNGGPGSHCLLYTSPSPRDATLSRMPSSA